jgi:predicted O-methyltransferase YrrM
MTDAITRLIDELDALGKTRDDAWQISRAEGEMLRQIALAANARVIVEVGTSYGFSGLFWGAALLHTGGLLHTIDVNPAKVESAKRTFADAGLSANIINHCGNAADILKTLHGPIDLAFIDADKPSTRAYFDALWPSLRVGGSILVDNATTHREQLAEFVKHVRSLPHAVSAEVAVGNGVEWTVKTKSV